MAMKIRLEKEIDMEGMVWYIVRNENGTFYRAFMADEEAEARTFFKNLERDKKTTELIAEKEI